MGLTKDEVKGLAPWAQEEIKRQMRAKGSDFFDKPDTLLGKAKAIAGYLLHPQAERQREINEIRILVRLAWTKASEKGLKVAAKSLEAAEQAIIDELSK